VAGATGAVGVHAVRALSARGVDVVPMTRGTGVDLLTGRGLDAALAGLDAVVDLSSVTTLRTRPAVNFFTRATANLLRAEQAAGIRHHVLLSIVGIDGLRSGYYAGKLAQEESVVAGPTPWSILRATQFHEFGDQLRSRGRVGPVIVVPRMTVQPVAAAEVADALADIVLGGPSGRAADLAGPRVEQLDDMVRRCEQAAGGRTPVLGVVLPGRYWREVRSGALLPGPGSRRGTVPFDEWLKTRVPSF
jgi:uncharacterized protein YbjT (DUF2867 family)